MRVYASGGNYEIKLAKGIAICRVWSRPDVSREQGAKFALEKAELLGKLAMGPRSMAKALLFDLRQAPGRWGPVTQGAIEQILSNWEIAGRRISVVVGPDPIQGMMIRHTVKRVASDLGRVATDLPAAEAWCLTGRDTDCNPPPG